MYLVPELFTFYIQDVLKLKNNSGAKRLEILADRLNISISAALNLLLSSLYKVQVSAR